MTFNLLYSANLNLSETRHGALVICDLSSIISLYVISVIYSGGQ